MTPHRITGMDPYIEAQRWRGFHTHMIVAIQEALTPQLLPKYAADIEERVYIEEETNGVPLRSVLYPDVAVETTSSEPLAQSDSPATAVQPVRRTVPLLAEQRERFVQIYTRSSHQLVTIIELLSPANKRPNSLGRSEYLDKRQRLFMAGVNLVEIDLLLQGERLPTNEPLPPGDYYAFVARRSQLPAVEVYYWRLGQPMPTIPIPLLEGDPDARLDLQAAYEQVYARARYDALLDFSQPLPFGNSD
ncbi:MAG: DUF4058 family protein [Fimbriimonadales bacterium]|nr:DUF4058 family protein [Fimbriimonadales bacterium]